MADAPATREHAAAAATERHAVSWPPAGTRPLPVDVVSVQSQVVYGRVGNSAAAPTLAALGLVTAAVPTVFLSNVPQYGTPHGGIIPLDWFRGYLDDLVARDALGGLRAVLTGYLGSLEQAQILAGWIRARRATRPGLRVVVDPVIGDHEYGVYVDPRLVDAYRDALLATADGLTPNDFELGHLAQLPVDDIARTVAAARSLLRGATEWIAVTSAAPAAWPTGCMQLVLVTRTQAWLLTHPRIGVEPKGTGDLFTASLTAYWLAGDALPDAAAEACQRVLEALHATAQARCAELLLPSMSPGRRGHPDVVVEALPFAT
ncbi:MAG TPA: pyridoxine/pyridoxal/pyridoxamine kinase [Rhodanobacteraceae bacterium]